MDPETAFVRSYVERRREELEGQLVSDEAARYARGHIESPTIFGEDTGNLFVGPEPAAWFRRLAGALLSWAYPASPLDYSLLPRPLTPEDVPRIYDAIFASSAEGHAPLGEFGPGLGLSRPQVPLDFDPGECGVFQQIRAELESRRGELSWKDIRLLLAHASGLTFPLATLYLLAFAYYGQPETELELATDHGLTFRDARPLRGRRLTREFMPLLPLQDDLKWWDALVAEKIVSLRLSRREVSWNGALQYTSLLCQGLMEEEDGSPEILRQERELLNALSELARDADRARDVLESLGGVITSPNKEQVDSTLHRLSEVCDGRDFSEVYELARRLCGNPQELLQELDLLRRLLYLGESLNEIVDLKAYLDGARWYGPATGSFPWTISP